MIQSVHHHRTYQPALLFLVALVSCAPLHPESKEPFSLDKTLFDAPRAFAEVEAFVHTGPRVSGTEGAKKAADYLLQRLVSIGIPAELQTFEDQSPLGTTTFHNVVGTLPGDRSDILILGSHFDTKYGIEGFLGANDSGSSSGLLLELGRVWKTSTDNSRDRPTLRLVFFDGEECRHRYGANDGFHGSKAYVDSLEKAGEIDRVHAMILLDMIGDRDLSVTIPRNSTPALALLAFHAATAVGRRDAFSWHEAAVGDDHVAFLDAGIPAIDLIDFQFGSAPGKNDYWHTPEDTMDKISIESLDTVGQVTLYMLQQLVEDLRLSKPSR